MVDLVDSLIKYVKDVKPFHTKIFGVEVEYHYKEKVNINIQEKMNMKIDIGVPLTDLNQFISPSEAYMNHTIRGGTWDDGSGLDRSPWDAPQDYISVPAGMLQDAIKVQFQEKLTFSIDVVGGEATPQYMKVDRWWDPYIDGVNILESTPSSVAIMGNVSKLFNQLEQITLIETTINDGVYDILATSYDADRNITYIHLVQQLFQMPVKVGKIQLSYFDFEEWDGDSSYINIVPPKADVYARSEFSETLTIVSGYSWDDQVTHWDSDPSGWDSGEIVLHGNSTKKHFTGWEYLTWDQFYPWDADGHLPGPRYDEAPFDVGLWDSDTIVSPIYDNSVRSIAFSAENMPLPSVYDPLT